MSVTQCKRGKNCPIEKTRLHIPLAHPPPRCARSGAGSAEAPTHAPTVPLDCGRCFHFFLRWNSMGNLLSRFVFSFNGTSTASFSATKSASTFANTPSGLFLGMAAPAKSRFKTLLHISQAEPHGLADAIVWQIPPAHPCLDGARGAGPALPPARPGVAPKARA